MSDFIRHESCPVCGSKNNVGVYADGNKNCFTDGCTFYIPPNSEYVEEEHMEVSVTTRSISTGTIKAIPDRKIEEDTCRRYGTMLNGTKHYYPYYNKEGEHIANKVRNIANKTFFSEGNIKEAMLFGQKSFQEGGKYVTICEGEVDAMSAYQLMGSKWPVVSIRNGAAAAAKDVTDNYDFLTSFDNIVICFDNDDAGRKASARVAEMLSPKAKVMSLQYKDANEYLLNNKKNLFVQDWWSAKTYTPEGIISGNDMWDTIIEGATEAAINYPYQGLQDLTYGIRMGELVTITAGSGLGKSQFLRELIYHVFKNTNDNIGMMFMEESVKRSGLAFMSLEADKCLHLPSEFSSVKDEDLKKYFDDTLGTGRLFFYDHFGSNAIDSILNRIRYFAKALNCKYVVLDHISILVSDQNVADERRAIDEMMTKMRTVVQELDIALLIVSHLRRPSGTGHEEGSATSLSQLRGSASIGQLSDIVIGLERNGQHEDEIERHTTTVRVIKNRFSGLTGPACRVYYGRDTGRLTEVHEEFEELE